MRYVIIIFAMAVFMMWDGYFHGFQHTEMFISEVQRVLTAVGV